MRGRRRRIGWTSLDEKPDGQPDDDDDARRQ
jgi:hypothetical protein